MGVEQLSRVLLSERHCFRVTLSDLETRTRSPGGLDRGLGLAERVVLQAGEKGGKSIRRACRQHSKDLGTPQAAEESWNQCE